ncbi:MAG: UGSC family (seleno)protein [Solirubrobacteraceae bacterium]
MTRIEVLSPVASAEPVPALALAPRTASPLHHAHLTLISNGKPRARELLTCIAEELGALIDLGEVEVFSKPTAAFPISVSEARAIAERSDLAIAALGDCGACSACSLHDAVQLERLGVPATVVITDVFQRTIASFSRTLGVEGYHSVVLPHPVSSRSDARLRELARESVLTVRDQLVAPARLSVAAA